MLEEKEMKSLIADNLMVLNSLEDVVEEQLNQWAANDSSTCLVQRGCKMSCVRDYKCPKMKKLGFSKGLTAWNCSTPRAQQSEDQKENQRLNSWFLSLEQGTFLSVLRRNFVGCASARRNVLIDCIHPEILL